ncbi:MAG: S-methyl-5-thioribose-1-phosphate isomerase [Desulfurococcales archaeon]|nr:S-methyl-5-thioribose-1-phosphate isomerase [Desulfurococcales archaeon]
MPALDNLFHKYSELLKIKPLIWHSDTKELEWLDTRLLPKKEVYRRSGDYMRIATAIKDMEVRGAPAIGVTAGFGLAAASHRIETTNIKEFMSELHEVYEVLRNTRPTAYNLFYALDKVWKAAENAKEKGDIGEIRVAVENEAVNLMVEDITSNIEMGKYGSKLLEDGMTILTHCNAGAVATSGFGTALGVIRYAWYEGKEISVIADETRPLLQGARLTVWELWKEGIPVKLITDNMAGLVLSKGLADAVIVGADRVIYTGHTANKIGTYMVALSAKRAGKPFYVALPTSTIQATMDPGSIVIEERNPDEVRKVMGELLITVEDIPVYNFAFDVTPPDLITAFMTEKGIVYPPFPENLKRVKES